MPRKKAGATKSSRVEQLIDLLKRMNSWELRNLGKRLEDAGLPIPIIISAPPAQTQEPAVAEEETRVYCSLTMRVPDYNESELSVIRALRRCLQLDLLDARDMTAIAADSPLEVGKELSSGELVQLADALRKAGAEVTLNA